MEEKYVEKCMLDAYVLRFGDCVLSGTLMTLN